MFPVAGREPGYSGMSVSSDFGHFPLAARNRSMASTAHIHRGLIETGELTSLGFSRQPSGMLPTPTTTKSSVATPGCQSTQDRPSAAGAELLIFFSSFPDIVALLLSSIRWRGKMEEADIPGADGREDFITVFSFVFCVSCFRRLSSFFSTTETARGECLLRCFNTTETAHGECLLAMAHIESLAIYGSQFGHLRRILEGFELAKPFFQRAADTHPVPRNAPISLTTDYR